MLKRTSCLLSLSSRRNSRAAPNPAQLQTRRANSCSPVISFSWLCFFSTAGRRLRKKIPKAPLLRSRVSVVSQALMSLSLSWSTHLLEVDELAFRSGCGSEHAPFNGRLCVELTLWGREFLDFYVLDQNENKPEYASTCVLAITNVNMSKIQVFNCANKLSLTLFLTQFNDFTTQFWQKLLLSVFERQPHFLHFPFCLHWVNFVQKWTNLWTSTISVCHQTWPIVHIEPAVWNHDITERGISGQINGVNVEFSLVWVDRWPCCVNRWQGFRDLCMFSRHSPGHVDARTHNCGRGISQKLLTCSFVWPDGVALMPCYLLYNLLVDAWLVHTCGHAGPKRVIGIVSDKTRLLCQVAHNFFQRVYTHRFVCVPCQRSQFLGCQRILVQSRTFAIYREECCVLEKEPDNVTVGIIIPVNFDNFRVLPPATKPPWFVFDFSSSQYLK